MTTAPEAAGGARAAAFDECISVAERWRDDYAERNPWLGRDVEAKHEVLHNVLTHLVKTLTTLKNASTA